MRLAVLAQLVVEQVRVQLDLVDRGHDVGLGRSRCELLDREVRDADRARAAVALELLKRLPGRHEVAVVQRRQRPMDQEEIDVVDAELGERASNAQRASSGRWAPLLQLAGDEDVSTVEPRGADRLPDPALVAVHLGGIDMPVANLQRAPNRALAVSSGAI